MIDNKRRRHYMLIAMEKLRKDLSMDTEASICIENITEDEDFEHEFTRDEYEIIVQTLNSQFQKLLCQTI